MPKDHPHYIVVCIGTTGDIHPFLRIAKTFQALGRKVTFIANTFHAKLLEGSGLRFVGLGSIEDYLRVVQNPNIWDERKGFATLLANYGELLEQIDVAIRSVVDHSPAIAIAHPLAVPGAAMSRELGIIQSIVSFYLAPTAIRTCHDPVRIGSTTIPRWFPLRWRRAVWRFVEKRWIDPLGIRQINGRRRALNLTPLSTSFLAHMENTPDLTVTLFPSWFGPAMPDWPQPLLTGDFQLYEAESSDHFSQALSAFLSAGDKPVVFTPGTGNVHAAAFFSCALAAVSKLGCRAIFLSRERAQIPANLPATVLWQPYVPLSGLLPHTAALVHHGGIGTTAEALRAGKPQLVVPFGWDQFGNGARTASLGAGLVIPAKKLQPRKLGRTLHRLITSEDIRSRCEQLAAHFIPPHDPAALCTEIDHRMSKLGVLTNPLQRTTYGSR
jgi:rhamnosyltransferase subunit B